MSRFKFAIGSRVTVRSGALVGVSGTVLAAKSSADENGVARCEDQYEVSLPLAGAVVELAWLFESELVGAK